MKEPIAAPELDLSVVLPVYNESGNLETFIPALSGVLRGLGRSYEIIAVDDGSTDASVATLRRLKEQEPHLRIIRFRRNFGQTAGFTAGFDLARGEYVITMDADGQNDPADIPKLLKVMAEGEYDIVSGWREERKEPFLSRRLPSMVRRTTHLRVPVAATHSHSPSPSLCLPGPSVSACLIVSLPIAVSLMV